MGGVACPTDLCLFARFACSRVASFLTDRILPTLPPPPNNTATKRRGVSDADETGATVSSSYRRRLTVPPAVVATAAKAGMGRNCSRRQDGRPAAAVRFTSPATPTMSTISPWPAVTTSPGCTTGGAAGIEIQFFGDVGQGAGLGDHFREKFSL